MSGSTLKGKTPIQGPLYLRPVMQVKRLSPETVGFLRTARPTTAKVPLGKIPEAKQGSAQTSSKLLGLRVRDALPEIFSI